MKMQPERIYKNAFSGLLRPAMAIMVYVIDGGGPKDFKKTPNFFLTKRDKDVF